MTLFFTMLPFYLLGNFHCMGMCGPLVALIGRHRHRYAYFFGRTAAFGAAGAAAGATGEVITAFLAEWGLSAALMILFGAIMALAGAAICLGASGMGGVPPLSLRPLRALQNRLSLLALREGRLPMFLYGAFALALPCGQSMWVFAACALQADALVGGFNGVAFALITSPSLLLSMQLPRLLGASAWAQRLHGAAGISLLLCGAIAICRGLADLSLIAHCSASWGSVHMAIW